jgi:hypothetical protein
MPYIPRGWWLTAAAFVVSLLVGMAGPRDAQAQELRPSLRIPTTLASVAAAADWASTYHAMTNYHVRETNILLQPWQDSPGKLVVIGAALDVATFTAWNKMLGPRHPKVAAAGMWAMAGFRTYLVFHNLRNEQRAVRRSR